MVPVCRVSSLSVCRRVTPPGKDPVGEFRCCIRSPLFMTSDFRPLVLGGGGLFVALRSGGCLGGGCLGCGTRWWWSGFMCVVVAVCVE